MDFIDYDRLPLAAGKKSIVGHLAQWYYSDIIPRVDWSVVSSSGVCSESLTVDVSGMARACDLVVESRDIDTDASLIYQIMNLG